MNYPGYPMVSFVPDAGAGRLALQGQVEVLAGQDGLMVPNLILFKD